MPTPNHDSRPNDLGEDILEKLDAGLSALLRMGENEIADRVQAEERRRQQQLDDITRLADILTPTATPAERLAVAQVQAMMRARLRAHPIYTVITVAGKAGPVTLPALVHFTGNRDDLASLGLEVRMQAHDVFAVVGTVGQLTSLAAQPATLRMQLPTQPPPGVERAAAQAEIDQVHKAAYGYLGTNVIIGVLDTPLDVAHHAFRDPAPGGSHGTRVHSYWIQDSGAGSAKPPAQVHPAYKDFTTGRLFTSKEINTALGLAAGPYGTGQNQIDRTPEVTEHGTFVAGIAAGNGYEPDWTKKPVHVGAAPRATLVHVIGKKKFIDEDEALAAAGFVFTLADIEKKPAVVNFSAGGHSGPHRGSENWDRAIDNLINSYQERVMVGISQNWNDAGGFRRGTIAPGGTDQFTMTVKSGYPRVEIWYPPPALEFRYDVGAAPTGTWLSAGTPYHDQPTELGHGVTVWTGFREDENLRGLTLTPSPTESPITIELRNPGGTPVPYYAWVCLDPGDAELSGPTHDELTLCSHGCCKSMLIVGTCGQVTPPDPGGAEQIAAMSGAGPTLDGRIKPEIVAVGGDYSNVPLSLVASANSHPSSDANRDYSVMSAGTSYAAPLVAGAVALLFEDARQRGYKLDADTVKALLTNHAHQTGLHLDPNQPGFAPVDRNRYGYGRLRTLAAIDVLAPPVDVDVWVRTAEDDYGRVPYIGSCFWAAPDIKVFERGTTTEAKEVHWGSTYDVQVTVRNLGDDKAGGTTVRLRYTRPVVAPTKWFPAEDENNAKLERTDVDVPALGKIDVRFTWKPESAEINPLPGENHFCLIAEVDHPKEKARLPQGDDPWEAAIKHTNNRALRNVIIL